MVELRTGCKNVLFLGTAKNLPVLTQVAWSGFIASQCQQDATMTNSTVTRILAEVQKLIKCKSFGQQCYEVQ